MGLLLIGERNFRVLLDVDKQCVPCVIQMLDHFVSRKRGVFFKQRVDNADVLPRRANGWNRPNRVMAADLY